MTHCWNAICTVEISSGEELPGWQFFCLGSCQRTHAPLLTYSSIIQTTLMLDLYTSFPFFTDRNAVHTHRGKSLHSIWLAKLYVLPRLGPGNLSCLLTCNGQAVTCLSLCLRWAATLGIVLAASRGLIVEPGTAFEPELAMLETFAHTHYLPRHWRGRAHTREVQSQFQTLFQFKVRLLG